MKINWFESNGTFLAYLGGIYCGMASQNDRPGKWSAVWHVNGGIKSTGWFDTSEHAKIVVEQQLAKL